MTKNEILDFLKEKSEQSLIWSPIEEIIKEWEVLNNLEKIVHDYHDSLYPRLRELERKFGV